MIWTLTPNLALDITWLAPGWVRGGDQRVTDITERPGGKGVNVARILDQLGVSVGVLGFLGGGTGMRVDELLAGLAPLVQREWVTVTHDTRRTVAVHDTEVTMFKEAGHSPSPAHWGELLERIGDLLAPGDVLAVCGSMPGDTPEGTLTAIAHMARACGAHVVMESSAGDLLEAARVADLVRPSLGGLRRATGLEDPQAGIDALLDLGVGGVVVWDPASGMQLWTPTEVLTGSLTRRTGGSAVGAADAAVAAWCRAVATWGPVVSVDEGARSLPPGIARDGLVDAVATRTAALARPVAGEIDTDLREELLGEVTVERRGRGGRGPRGEGKEGRGARH